MQLQEDKFNAQRMGNEQQDVSRNNRYNYCVRGMAFILWWGTVAGCTSLKKATMIGGGALIPGAIASVATSGSAPVLLASTVGASVTSVVADVMTTSKGGNMPTAANCAPDNFWTLLGGLVEMGGIYLIAILIIPMLAGWLLPGPLERKKKK
tara:strand:+ start:7902 stop:8357 length:456 start_codon:yes stop_codon:yes gene_type:complete